MAYDERLASRIDAIVRGRPGVTQREMFGGVAWLVDGKMFVGIVKNDLMARVGPERFDRALSRAHVRPMDFTGRPMVGYVYVSREGLTATPALRRWIDESIAFVQTLHKSARRPRRTGSTAKRSRDVKKKSSAR